MSTVRFQRYAVCSRLQKRYYPDVSQLTLGCAFTPSKKLTDGRLLQTTQARRQLSRQEWRPDTMCASSLIVLNECGGQSSSLVLNECGGQSSSLVIERTTIAKEDPDAYCLHGSKNK